MSAPTARLPLPDRYGYTVADLHALPEDGRRHELIDGSLIVSICPAMTARRGELMRLVAEDDAG